MYILLRNSQNLLNKTNVILKIQFKEYCVIFSNRNIKIHDTAKGSNYSEASRKKNNHTSRLDHLKSNTQSCSISPSNSGKKGLSTKYYRKKKITN